MNETDASTEPHTSPEVYPGDVKPGVHRIVVVGGGAGGLELVTRLGDKLGRRGRAHITLIEKARTHFWKPHLHEVAAGSADLHDHATSYLAQARWHGFRYRMGEMVGLDRDKRLVYVAPVRDDEDRPITPAYTRAYDTLVIGVGSQTNDFGTPGVAEHAIALETPDQAQRFHRRLVNACIRAHMQAAPFQPHQLQVVIIGAGATGVELAAELHKATRTLVSYGLERIDPQRDIRLHLLEAGPRILPALPERVAGAAHRLLQGLGVQVRTGARVTAVRERSVELEGGQSIPAELVVWAAGVKAPTFLQGLAGLETNRLNQLVVTPTLQTTRDERIFALGDCAAAPWLGQEERRVPPRAQAAHQQASHLVQQLQRRLRGQPLKPWRYRDFGSLVSLGEYSTVGNLMGSLVGGNLWVEGLFARTMYLSLYKMTVTTDDVRARRLEPAGTQSGYRNLYYVDMKTTLNLNDQLLADAKALAAQQRTSLTRLIEEGLQLRLRAKTDSAARGRIRLPVFKGRGGLVKGVNPLSNKALLEALGDDA